MGPRRREDGICNKCSSQKQFVRDKKTGNLHPRTARLSHCREGLTSQKARGIAFMNGQTPGFVFGRLAYPIQFR